jgi:hypothetical protein
MTDNHLPVISQPPIEEIIASTQDVSARVVELMRKLDRLPAGTYEITIVKSDVRAMAWMGDITRLERIENFRLSRYHAE